MKKLLSKALSIIIVLLMILPATSTVFAKGLIINRITPVNNAVGTPDTVTVASLEVGDIIKVYSDATGGIAIGSVTATSITRSIVMAGRTIKGTETTAIVSIPQLGAGAGSVYVSVTSRGLIESDRVEVSYAAEAATIISSIMKGTTVNNSVGTSDTVTIKGLALGDIIKVYQAATADGVAGIGSAIGTATAVADKVNGIIAIATIPQLGAAGGNVYVSVTSKGLLESDKLIKVQYFAEQRSSTPFVSNITTKNNALGTSDTVTVTNLVVGDIVKVYSDATSNGKYSVGEAIGTATATTDRGTTTTGTATVSIPQLGSVAGNIYVSVISKGLIESTITKAVAYLAEPKSTALFAVDIKSINNATGTPDTVTVAVTTLIEQDMVKTYQPVIGLAVGDIVKVYQAETGGIAIGTATVTSKIITLGSQQIKITEVTAIATIPQLGVVAGNVYVTVTSKGLLESDRTKVAYVAEAATMISPLATGTTVNNAVGTPDTVTITGLAVGDIVKVYSEEIIEGTPLAAATATATADKGNNGAIATASIPQFGTGAGNVYVTVTSKGLHESEKLIKVPYFGEQRSNTPFVANITPKNNAVGTTDTVTVTNLQVGDIVKVYSTSTADGKSAIGEAMGTAIAIADKAATGIAKVSIPQLGATKGYIYVSVISKGLLESNITTPVAYLAEPKSTAPFVGNVTTKNNAYGTSDTIIVTGLAVGDIVKVYSASTIDGTRGAGKAIGTAIGVADKAATGMVATSTATVIIPQIGVSKGNIYISVTSKGCLESNITTAVKYDAEIKTEAPMVVH
ncbi:hypothetical protein K9O30_01605 [Clostridium bowmanii]|uniref:hypothetical protein n=1 Tax=Clostridium bowmanii TaxID=132925 RepID=UPI001C0C7E4B|nr:hypothetical protein [Clostridium bowmanii]MBU3190332.1 hypothetical protein [Clostridium bowmanii]MCA1072455.1 hypothetical protein [Clostridium bowmanii]